MYYSPAQRTPPEITKSTKNLAKLILYLRGFFEDALRLLEVALFVHDDDAVSIHEAVSNGGGGG